MGDARIHGQAQGVPLPDITLVVVDRALAILRCALSGPFRDFFDRARAAGVSTHSFFFGQAAYRPVVFLPFLRPSAPLIETRVSRACGHRARFFPVRILFSVRTSRADPWAQRK